MPFRQTLSSSRPPLGLTADARGYFKPGSMGNFLVTQAWEEKRQGMGAPEPLL